jgi:hypothetical protein
MATFPVKINPTNPPKSAPKAMSRLFLLEGHCHCRQAQAAPLLLAVSAERIGSKLQNKKSPVRTLADSILSRPLYAPAAAANLDRGQVLTRYLTDWKFTDLVGTSSLFFPRLRLLSKQDPDEARIATSAYLDESLVHNRPDGIRSDQNAYLEFLKVGPHEQAYASCWYIGEASSDHMWGEYVPGSEGVAVSTTVGQLADCFTGSDPIKVASIAPIEYVNFHEAAMPGLERRDDRVAALKYKGDGWKHENEMRAIILYDMYYVSPQLPIIGERLPIVIDAFVNSMVIAPKATKEYGEAVRDFVANTPLAGRVA